MALTGSLEVDSAALQIEQVSVSHCPVRCKCKMMAPVCTLCQLAGWGSLQNLK
jgi:hypothetical protein